MTKETNPFILGIDIGGSHITTAMVQMGSHSIIENTCIRKPVNSFGYLEEIIEAWAEAIEESWAAQGLTSSPIGMAMPGPFDYEQGISLITGLNKYEALYKQPVKKLLAERLRIPPANIKMINDASAFLLGEVMSGTGKGFKRVVGITLGTGVGSAMYLDGVLHEGDLWCTPFKTSRAEDYLSTRWFIQQYGIQSGKIVRGVKELQQMAAHDVRIKKIFHDFGQHLAEILCGKYLQHCPDMVVIGGNIIHTWDLFMPAVQAYFKEHNSILNLQKARLGEKAAIIGAACLWELRSYAKM